MKRNLVKRVNLEIKGNEDGKISIGKILDLNFNLENSSIVKELPNSFKIVTKNSNKTESKYTSTVMAEQTAKYILLNYRPSKNTVEIYPTEEWNNFRKEPNYKVKELDEVEELMKPNHKPELKPKKVKGKGDNNLIVSVDPDENNDDNDEDRKLFSEYKKEPMFKKKTKRKKGGDGSDELDSYSDEEDFFDKFEDFKRKETEGVDVNKEIETSELDDNTLLGEEEEVIESEVNEDMSEELDEEGNSVKEDNNVNNLMTGNKRKREGEYENDKEKKIKPNTNIEDIFNFILHKKRKLKMSEIIKEFTNLNYSENEIFQKINTLVNKFCTTFSEKNETYYVLKTK